MIDRKPFRTLERTVNQGNIQLQSYARVESITNYQLVDRAIEVLIRRIRRLLAINLDRPEVRELLCYRSINTV